MNRYITFLKHALFLFVICIWSPSWLLGQEEWKVEEAHGSHKDVEFDISEGTWMNLDISPDDREIAFDLLGDIYMMPVSGGRAYPLSTGLAWEVQPRFSPDGNRLLYTSDKGGGDNIWSMKRDGTEAEQLTDESYRLLNNPYWHPSGKYFVARKHYTATRSLGAGEMWMYHSTGGGGMRLTERKNDQQDAGEPVFSPDGHYVYYSEDMDGAGYFTYNKNPHKQIYVIKRYDTETGKTSTVISGPGGAVRPQASHDGKHLAFVRRVRSKTVLYIHDLESGEEWPVFDRLNKDQQETWATFGVYPNYQWFHNNKEILIWAEGKIWRVNIETRDAKEIPFKVKVKQQVAEAVNFPQEVSPEIFTSKMIRDGMTSPDGKRLVFHAAGHLYEKSMPNGKPKRISNDTAWEYDPFFSSDGRYMVYTTWSDEELSQIRLRETVSGATKILPLPKGYYHHPRISPDGKKLTYQRGGGTTQLGYAFGKEGGLYVCDLNGNNSSRVLEYGSDPYWAPDGEHLYFTTGGGLSKKFQVVDLMGKDVRPLFSAKYARDFVPSPDGNWIAFTELFNVYVAAFPKVGQAVDLNSSTNSYPVFQVTRDAGTSLHWSKDSKELRWMLGPEYFDRSLTDCFEFLQGSPDSLPPVDTAGIAVGLDLSTDIPDGKVALVGARIVTMNGDKVIENGTILVDRNRIVAVGPAGEIKVPGDAYTMDVRGKTIIPGLIDVHAHLGNSWNGISPEQQWSYYANLAYGVTTTHDPSSNTEMVFGQSEMVKAGHFVGPRIYSTGTILYGADGDFRAQINSLEDAKSSLRRLKAVGAFSVKSYNQPRRDQRQQVIQAARELEMNVYPEGGSFFYHNLTMVVDGHTGVEHSIPVSPVYQDVVKLWGASSTGYTPTLIVGYGGIWGENYWYQKTEVWKNERLLQYYPRRLLDARSMRRMMVPDDDFGHIGNAKTAKAIADGGTQVQLGAHGQLQGLGAHWELWMIEQGGFSPMEALRAGTLWGAEYIGMGKELGSLEVGKLADLVILEKNPLENIRNSEFVDHVMINGRLYEAATMNEVGNYNTPRGKFFWERAKGSEAFPWHEASQSFMENKCSCFGHQHQ